MCLFYRPGILKDLKTMGSISLFIFFITLLVLGRQVRHTLLCTCTRGDKASCHMQPSPSQRSTFSCSVPYPCKGLSGASIKLFSFLPSNGPLKVTTDYQWHDADSVLWLLLVILTDTGSQLPGLLPSVCIHLLSPWLLNCKLFSSQLLQFGADTETI